MSKTSINQYYQSLDRTVQFGKSRNEQSIRNHFWSLLNEYARSFNYEVVPEIAILGTKGKKVIPDGTVKNLWGLDIGLWESKDEKDDIEAEIDSKIKKGYPLTNILFEDSNIAVLFQRGVEVSRIRMKDADKLHQLLTDFLSFKSETVYKFEDAIEKFKADIPIIVETLRNKILASRETNKNFLVAQASFFELCKVEINPDITIEDIREMLIQHILTSDIFNKIFDDSEFHHHNTIAAELEKLISILFTYAELKNLLYSIEHYYEAINSTAASITDHHEKQKFLKILYENFYKVYNPKAADRLGVVYTPNEIVQFMVQSTNYILQKHFNKILSDKGIEILDPATGTGTFICEIIENAIPKHLLDYKFKNEIHANEVSILPYYIANLNIEYTFKQKMLYYAEFPNLCFVDTLDNTDSLSFSGKQHSLFGLSSENSERIKRQNSKKISVIIGNPPYNSNQAQFNDNNKNRLYPLIDKRIKDTFVKYSNATNKANLYDMYTRFYRWTMDRIDKNGIICMITNNSFIHKKAFDGFRRIIQQEFDHAYIIDMGGDIRDLSGKDGIWLNEENTIFGIAAAVGISIMVLVKKESLEKTNCKINYIHPCDIRAKRTEKIEWLKNNSIDKINFNSITPNMKADWINQSQSDLLNLLPLIDKNLKEGKGGQAIFKTYSLGIATHRDDWVYDFSKTDLEKKMKYFINVYQKTKEDEKYIHKNTIAWDRELNNYCKRKIEKRLDSSKIVQVLFRPFVKQYYYFDKHFTGMLYQFGNLYRLENPNLFIAVNREGNSKPFHILVANTIADLHTTGDSQCLPLYYFDKEGRPIENITDWALDQFQSHYGDLDISKPLIYNYLYAVLHNPSYRKKYELDLKQEFPHIPFYNDFSKWTKWGKELIDLHIGYENVSPYPIQERTYSVKAEAKSQKELYANVTEPASIYTRQPKLKVKLKADKEAGIIEIDELTFLTGVPLEAWEYKLGNRSALEWVLDQYKEKKPKDPTIAEKFNTYRFADYKVKVIDLLKRVCTVSVETMRIIKEMQQSGDSDLNK